MKLSAWKSQSALTQEWDTLAAARDESLAAGEDLSYSHSIKPWILERISAGEDVVDAGCGTGRLTEDIAQIGANVVGIDPSPISIRLASTRATQARFECATLEQWVVKHPKKSADTVVASMVLMDVPDLAGFFASAAALTPGGRLVATLTHPAFWPLYWGYAKLPEFDYLKETAIETNFRTRGRTFNISTTHFHRPVMLYMSRLLEAGFDKVRLSEIRGPEEIDEFRFPRFLGLEASVRG